MPAAKEKVGFIFECGPDGADYQVCQEFLGRLNPAIEIIPRFLDNQKRLLSGCGEVAALLLNSEKCSRVVVTWDLEPPWGGKACRHQNREDAFASLKSAEVPLQRVLLLCVERELEGWLMTDHRALKTVFERLKHPHPVGKLPHYKNPDRTIKRPKTELVSLFEQELGRGRKYLDRDHALLIARAVPDWQRVKRSDSFCRFAEKVAKVKLREGDE